MTILKTNNGDTTVTKIVVALFTFVMLCFPSRADIVLETTDIGDAGNKADSTGYGAVSYSYRIGKYEVTNHQYAAFLNAVDADGTNPHGIYNGSMGSDARGGISYNPGASLGSKYSTKINMGSKPVNYVSFFDAMRFTNWLHNGQPSDGSGTETGAYAINDGVREIRNPDARFFIPSEDEWYKAAYFQPFTSGGDTDDYWLYATSSNIEPTVAAANIVGDIANPGLNVVNFNFGADWNGLDGNITSVGSAGASSASYYGTFDQSGNLYEWNETVASSLFRGARGGDWFGSAFTLRSIDGNGLIDPSGEFDRLGFRVATVPEPSLTFMGLLFTLCLLWRIPCYHK